MTRPKTNATIDADFWARVDRACSGLVLNDHSREMDNCFEMYDGAYVVAAIMRRAQNEPRLMRAIEADFSGELAETGVLSWTTVAAKYAAIPNEKLAATAREATQ